MNIEEKKADFIRRFKASRERKAEYIAQMEKRNQVNREEPQALYRDLQELSSETLERPSGSCMGRRNKIELWLQKK